MLKPFFVWSERVLKRIDPLTVVYLETEKNYTYTYLSDKDELIKCMLRFSLETALNKLPEDIFIRTSRSTAVSIYYIEYIARTHLVVTNNISIPIGKNYYDSIIEKLNVID